MGNSKLYKYLDVNGGISMLHYSNLQFTNATRLNDPFDIHPSLIDFSNVPAYDQRMVWGKDAVIALEANRHERLRDDAWVCSLSKVHDSLLMWAYYGNHRGVCVGIDMDKANKYLNSIRCTLILGAMQFDVQYMDIIQKPDYFHDCMDYYKYQLSTKAKAWEHEQEVRLILFSPSPGIMGLPYEPEEDELIDWKDVRAYPHIGGECFDSLHLGIKVDKEKKKRIIEEARMVNPEIKIFQMEPDPDAFRLIERLI